MVSTAGPDAPMEPLAGGSCVTSAVAGSAVGGEGCELAASSSFFSPSSFLVPSLLFLSK